MEPQSGKDRFTPIPPDGHLASHRLTLRSLIKRSPKTDSLLIIKHKGGSFPITHSYYLFIRFPHDWFHFPQSASQYLKIYYLSVGLSSPTER